MLNLVLVALGLSVALGRLTPWGPLPLHFATPAVRFRTGAHKGLALAQPRAVDTTLLLAQRRQERPPSRPIRFNPFATSDPLAKHRAITGINVHVRWYQRVSSLIGIVVLVAVMGVLVAAAIGVVFVAARIILELLVG